MSPVKKNSENVGLVIRTSTQSTATPSTKASRARRSARKAPGAVENHDPRRDRSDCVLGQATPEQVLDGDCANADEDGRERPAAAHSHHRR